MEDLDKRAQRIIRLTVCLCGMLVLFKTGRTVCTSYESPKSYLLHGATAFLAESARRFFLPAVTAGEESSQPEKEAMEQMALFFGWTSRQEETGYVEDEYTRQELIEAGRGGSLQDIQEENKKQADVLADKTAKETKDQKASQTDDTEIQETSENADPVTETTGTQQTDEPEKKDAETTEAAETVQPEMKEAQKDDAVTESTGGGAADRQLPSFQQLVQNQEKISPNELLKRFFVVDPVTTVEEGLLSYDVLTNTDLRLPASSEGVQIVIYHTHSQEAFVDSDSADVSTTIVGVGETLKKELEDRGYRVLHVTDTFDVDGQTIDRSGAYTKARKKIREILEENPTVQVLLDIHRDGVAKNKRLVTTVDGRPTAQIMFFNGLSRKKSTGALDGLSNPYLQENLIFSFQTEYLCDLYYPKLSRCIYLKAYRYNLDLLPRSMLVEVGAQTSTVEEAKNAMLPLADVLHKLLQGTP